MISISPPTPGCDPRLDPVNTDIFLDSFDFSATNPLFVLDLHSVDPALQLTPAASSDSAVRRPSAVPSDESSSSSSGGEAMHCNIGGDTTRRGSNHHGSNSVGKYCTTSPLQRAVQMGHSKIVRLLLDYHADYNEKDSEGRTPLINATIAGFEDVVDLLLSHGAGIEYVDHQHHSALHWAVIHRQDRLLKRLLQHCAGDRKLINECTKDGRTPLLIAIDAGCDAAVEALLESGADVQ
ncbi:ankyrin repeat-containing domain protein [Aspergillus bertholletiae]|uniref:Ankyrin repeat-containing domain protein n=1 Tax=Aspergillus bertholletiae TaxID=1226010 RepID=A0A5N7AW87_9EURO|nr:ankyrin repeat-containing domain protein [Aspergillus bertholletiae]